MNVTGMGEGGRLPGAGDDDAVLTAARAGDEPAFAALVERHRGELQVPRRRLTAPAHGTVGGGAASRGPSEHAVAVHLA